MYDYSKELERLSNIELYSEAIEHISYLLSKYAEDKRLYRRLSKLERIINEFGRRTGLSWEKMYYRCILSEEKD